MTELSSPIQRVAQAHDKRRISYQAGQYIFRQDDPTTGFYLLLEGTVELRRVLASGAQIILHRAQTGETFAEASLFSERYHCDAIARSPCELVRLRKSDVMSADEGDKVSASLIQHLSAQVQRYRLLLQLCSIRRADERVLAAMEAGFKPDNWKSFAPQIALSHEALYRALNSLSKQGLIKRLGRGEYQLSDPLQK
jgi:CRP-like cAMP-binding protein